MCYIEYHKSPCNIVDSPGQSHQYCQFCYPKNGSKFSYSLQLSELLQQVAQNSQHTLHSLLNTLKYFSIIQLLNGFIGQKIGTEDEVLFTLNHLGLFRVQTENEAARSRKQIAETRGRFMAPDGGDDGGFVKFAQYLDTRKAL